LQNGKFVLGYQRDKELGSEMKQDRYEQTFQYDGTRMGANFSSPQNFKFTAGFDFTYVHGAELSDEGILYLAVNEFKFVAHPLATSNKRYKNRKEKDNSNLCLIAIDLNNGELLKTETELSADGLKSCEVILSKNGDITFIGQTGPDYLSVDGLFSASFSSDLKLKYINSTNYSTDLAKSSNSEDLQSKGAAPFTSLSLDEVFEMNDGSFLSVCEQRYEKLIKYNNTSTTVYYYHDIILSNYTSSGKINWTKRIEKRQETKNDNALNSSYVVSSNGSELVFFFNEFEKANLSDVHLAKVQIDLNGAITKSDLGEIEEGVLVPSICKQAKDYALLYFNGPTNDRIARLDF
jgi:hypothetical protein